MPPGAPSPFSPALARATRPLASAGAHVIPPVKGTTDGRAHCGHVCGPKPEGGAQARWKGRQGQRAQPRAGVRRTDTPHTTQA